MNPDAEALKARTFRFALGVVAFCRGLRTTWEGRTLASQLLRSGTSIGANYHAACRARSSADFINKIGIVVEEADETVYWLRLIQAGHLADERRVDPLLREATELWAIFNQAQITAKANVRRRHQDGRKSRRPSVNS